jgi:chorismate mutase
MNMTEKPPTLEDLRREIDRIDTQLHDLIMKRTLVVDSVRQVKANERVKIRPGREAEMLYDLSAKHAGKFPKQSLLRIWREIISGTLVIEGPFCVAVQTTGNNTGYIDLARDHYGSYTTMAPCERSADVIDAVTTDRAAIGILPFPTAGMADPWWATLPNGTPEQDTIRVIARLPFFGRSSAPGADLDALVVSYAVPLKAGRDISLFRFETNHPPAKQELVEAFKRNGLDILTVTSCPDHNCLLVEVDGFANNTMIDLPDHFKNLWWLGSYSAPMDNDELFGPECQSGTRP